MQLWRERTANVRVCFLFISMSFPMQQHSEPQISIPPYSTVTETKERVLLVLDRKQAIQTPSIFTAAAAIAALSAPPLLRSHLGGAQDGQHNAKTAEENGTSEAAERTVRGGGGGGGRDADSGERGRKRTNRLTARGCGIAEFN